MRQRNGVEQCQMVPLAILLSRERKIERLQKPIIRYGLAAQAKKGEDYSFVKTDCQRIAGDRSSAFAVFAVLDGHNGAAAAIYTKENLLKNVMCAISPGLSRDEWLAALPRALVAGFVKTDKEFQKKEQSSGTTCTFVVVDGWTVTVACVGDSRCILDFQGVVSTLTVDHRLEENLEERNRVTASGGEVGRLSTLGGDEIGPLRCWPGGLCLSRSIGDMDVGEFIVPIPHVKQIKLANAGGRLIIASDGVWDALSCEEAARCCQGLPADLAAKQIVKDALGIRGLRDDTTCLVVDLMKPDNKSLPQRPVAKKRNKIKYLFSGKSYWESTAKIADRATGRGLVEELFEEGSAVLAERLASDVSFHVVSGTFNCAICQTDITPNEGMTVHAGSFFSMSQKPWEGPYLCLSCKIKKDAMEGKTVSLGDIIA
eukprot:c25388_g1_i1 orf=232-1515(+)